MKNSNLLLTLGVFFSVVGFAGEVVTSSTNTKTFFGKVRGKHVIYADGHLLRMETHLKGKLKSVTIINAKKQVMMSWDTKDRVYVHFTAAQFNQMAESANKALEDLQKQMKPDQRNAMQAFTKGMIDSATNYANSIEFKLVKKNVKVGKFKCDQYHGMSNGKRVSSMCMMPDSWFNSTSRVLKRVRKTQMRAFKAFGANNKMAQKYGLKKLAQTKFAKSGYPILSETDGMLGKSKMRVVSVQSKSLKASLFSPPKGYRKQTMERLAVYR